MTRVWNAAIGCVLSLSVFASMARSEDIAPRMGELLKAGQLNEAVTYLDGVAKADSANSQARFGLGLTRFFGALQQLSADQYRYGAFGGDISRLPILRMPIPVNPRPEEVTYAQARQVIQDFQERLINAEAELARIHLQNEVKLSLDLAAISLDLDGNGKIEGAESFQTLLGAVNRGRPMADLKVTLDNGDVPWLRGYCHFLCAFCDIVLAYDHQRMFDVAGQWFYPQPVRSQPLPQPLDVGERNNEREILDAIAAIHLADFPIREPKRMSSARGHLLEMIRTSRQSWELISAETDDDHEWLPSPKQSGILRIPVTREMIDSWHGILTEMEDLLEGRKLVPFWRDKIAIFGPQLPVDAQVRGVNLKRYFEEPPQRFDLILTIQGTEVLPYLDKGELSRQETWEQLARAFEGQFFGFAIWFN